MKSCCVGVSHDNGTLNWGPFNKDPIIWGTILGSPIFGKSCVASGYQQRAERQVLDDQRPRGEGSGIRVQAFRVWELGNLGSRV